MEKNDFNVLQESENMQFTIAQSSTFPDVLDSLADSPSDLVRMTAVSNPSIRTETLKRKLDDEDVVVRFKASEALEKRGIKVN